MHPPRLGQTSTPSAPTRAPGMGLCEAGRAGGAADAIGRRPPGKKRSTDTESTYRCTPWASSRNREPIILGAQPHRPHACLSISGPAGQGNAIPGNPTTSLTPTWAADKSTHATRQNKRLYQGRTCRNAPELGADACPSVQEANFGACAAQAPDRDTLGHPGGQQGGWRSLLSPQDRPCNARYGALGPPNGGAGGTKAPTSCPRKPSRCKCPKRS